MTRIDSHALQEFRRQLFGPNSVMPELYLDVLHSFIEGAEEMFGEQIPPGARRTQAFWLKGPSLGQLTCEGEGDQHAEIAGRLYRLSDPVTAELGVERTSIVFTAWSAGGVASSPCDSRTTR